jgi:hypothetical protein
MSGNAQEPMVTLSLAQGDWQLVMQVLSQALLPYQRLGQVMQGMQQQAAGSGQQAVSSGQQALHQPGGEARLNRPHAIGDEPGLMRREVHP